MQPRVPLHAYPKDVMFPTNWVAICRVNSRSVHVVHSKPQHCISTDNCLRFSFSTLRGSYNRPDLIDFLMLELGGPRLWAALRKKHDQFLEMQVEKQVYGKQQALPSSAVGLYINISAATWVYLVITYLRWATENQVGLALCGVVCHLTAWRHRHTTCPLEVPHTTTLWHTFWCFPLRTCNQKYNRLISSQGIQGDCYLQIQSLQEWPLTFRSGMLNLLFMARLLVLSLIKSQVFLGVGSPGAETSIYSAISPARSNLFGDNYNYVACKPRDHPTHNPHDLIATLRVPFHMQYRYQPKPNNIIVCIITQINNGTWLFTLPA